MEKDQLIYWGANKVMENSRLDEPTGKKGRQVGVRGSAVLKHVCTNNWTE